MNEKKQRLRQILCDLDNVDLSKDESLHQFNKRLKEEFQAFEGKPILTSRAFGNLIKYDSVPHSIYYDKQIYGYMLEGTDIFLSFLTGMLVNSEIPIEVYDRYPDITQEQWEACMVLVTDILAAFTVSIDK